MGKPARHLLTCATLGALTLPGPLFAAEALKDIVATFVSILNTAIPLVMLMALIAFVWGAVKLIYTAGEDKDRTANKQVMVWGMVALFMMVSVWGLVQIIYATFFE